MDPQGVIVLDRRSDDARRTWVRLLTQELGLVDAAVFGAQNSKKRFAGGLSPTMWGRGWGQLRSGKRTLTGFEVDPGHMGLRADPFAFAAGSYACELASLLLAQGPSDARLFETLAQGLRALGEGAFAGGVLRSIEIALLVHQGWMSEPGLCATCRDPERPALFFLESAGQWRCEAHASAWAKAYPEAVMRVLHEFYVAWQHNKAAPAWVQQGRYAQLPAQTRARCRQWCWQWIDVQLSRPLRSRAVLLELAR